MHPGIHQHKKVEDSAELDIKKEIFEPIILPPIRAEPDESTSNEVQTIDNAQLQSNIVPLYSCGVCSASFTDKLIRKD
jgi:hypothetical protein